MDTHSHLNSTYKKITDCNHIEIRAVPYSSAFCSTTSRDCVLYTNIHTLLLLSYH